MMSREASFFTRFDFGAQWIERKFCEAQDVGRLFVVHRSLNGPHACVDDAWTVTLRRCGHFIANALRTRNDALWLARSLEGAATASSVCVVDAARWIHSQRGLVESLVASIGAHRTRQESPKPEPTVSALQGGFPRGIHV